MNFIHKEGYRLLAIVGIVFTAILIALAYFIGTANVFFIILFIIFGVFFGIIFQFFRNPTPKYTLDESVVVAPAEGKIVVIEEVYEPEFLKTECIQISIFMSPFNVHVNRNPISGLLSYFKYHPGKYLVAWHPKSSMENERTTLAITNAKQQTILFRQIAGALAKRICWYVKEGDFVRQGEEFGFIKFGSRVDVFVPKTSTILVQMGQKTRCAETPLARLP